MSILSFIFPSAEDDALKERPATWLDAVTYASGLASNPRALDTILDTVVHLTANLPEGQGPSKEDDKVLARVYFEVEHYLATKEPIRAFSPEEIRSRLSDGLRQQIQLMEHKKE